MLDGVAALWLAVALVLGTAACSMSPAVQSVQAQPHRIIGLEEQALSLVVLAAPRPAVVLALGAASPGRAASSHVAAPQLWQGSLHDGIATTGRHFW